MSLRVWLPLNGSLENKGLDDVTVTNNGAVVDNNGKIGKCYSFGTENSYMTVDSEPIKHFTEFSFACWVKIISWNKNYATIFAIKNSTNIFWNNLIFSLLRNGSSSTLCFNIAGHGGYTSASCCTEELNLNTWYHIVGTYKTGEIKLYQDGVLINTYETAVIPTFDAINNFWIGKANANSYQSNILLNDFRIYNHTLSPMEVKQISQGLILHYPLNDKYIEDTTNLVIGVSAGGQTTVNNNVVTTSGENKDTFFSINLSEDIVVGTQYTLSCDAEIPSGVWSFPLGSQSNTLGFILHNGHNVCTFIANNINWGAKRIFMDDNSGGSSARSTGLQTKIYNFQLEKKDHETGFAGYGASRTNTIVYDTSGYNNNGTAIGNLECSSDTPRYDVSTHFGATNSKIRIDNLITTGFSNSYTFSWWGKYTTLGNSMFWGFQNGVRLNGVYHGIYWNTSDGNSNPIYKPGTTTVVTAPEANVWHHYVMTGDNTVCKLYVDGELYGQAKTHKTISGNIIYINGWDSGTGYSFTDMNMSDFRVYCTTLSPEDVLDLYNLGAAIDTNNNLYSTMLEEV